MIQFFITYKALFIILHAFAAAAGLGAVLVIDILFLRFIQDKKISPHEYTLLKSLSSWIWLVIICLIITGSALYFSAPYEYLIKSKFVTKMIIFGVIIINGYLMHRIIMPTIQKITFQIDTPEKTKKDFLIKRFAFISGGISLFSWIIVFLLGSLRSIPFSLGQALTYYILGIGGIILIVPTVIRFRESNHSNQ